MGGSSRGTRSSTSCAFVAIGAREVQEVLICFILVRGGHSSLRRHIANTALSLQEVPGLRASDLPGFSYGQEKKIMMYPREPCASRGFRFF